MSRFLKIIMSWEEMLVEDAIRGRRSIRAYKQEPVPMDAVRSIVEAGTWAPSAMNGQQWRFTCLTGDAKKNFTGFFREELLKIGAVRGNDLIASSLGSYKVMEQAPVVIIIWNAGQHGWEVESQSVCAAIQNMLLEAYALGLGSLWIANVHYAHHQIVGYFKKTWDLIAAVTVGWPADAEKQKPPPKRMGVDEVAEFLF